MTGQKEELANNILNKVPEVTLVFWLIKMMSTTVGETAADFLNVNLHFGLTGTSAVMGVLLLISLFFQLRTKTYRPPFYWISVVFISVFGTLITDNLTDHLGVPLAVSTAVFSALLIVTFCVWYARERTLSIHKIDTLKRELFYWTAVLFTFALGTAAGDWVAEGCNIGYMHAALAFGGAIAVIAAAYKFFHADATMCFWFAYVLTRPFGASCGDLLAQDANHGGLGLGITLTSVIFLTAITVMVVYLSLSVKNQFRAPKDCR